MQCVACMYTCIWCAKTTLHVENHIYIPIRHVLLTPVREISLRFVMKSFDCITSYSLPYSQLENTVIAIVSHYPIQTSYISGILITSFRKSQLGISLSSDHLQHQLHVSAVIKQMLVQQSSTSNSQQPSTLNK